MKNDARIAVFFIIIVLLSGNTEGQTLSGTVNSYYAITAVSTAANAVTVDNAAGLSIGQRVFLYQAKGASITATNTASYGNITTANDAGAYEFNTICNISGNEVWLVNALANNYDPTAMAQLITVAHGSSLTVAGSITAQPWDSLSGKGGIVVLEATSSITLNADINVAGQGFEGGTLINWAIPPYNCSFAITVSDYYMPFPASGSYNTAGRKGEGIAAYITGEEFGRGKLANGAGGGDNANSGGGGGGNYGTGGAGGQRSGESAFSCHAQNPGLGGASLASYGYTTAANRIFFGGGGGSGEENNAVGEPGGNGGGIIVLSAPVIVGAGGRLLASGVSPTNPLCSDPYQAEGDGGGGGGAGGTIVLNASSVTGTITADASGANGSNSSNHVSDCTGPGGGGAGGAIWAAGPTFPGAVTATVNGGANGVISSGSSKTPSCVGASNGATAGTAGAAITGYTLPVSSGPVCVVLATPALQYFNAVRSDRNIMLSWALASPQTAVDIRDFILQRSSDLSHFTNVATLPCSKDSITYHYTDGVTNSEGTVDYRLAWQNLNGEWFYSRIVAIEELPGPDGSTIRLFPDPATNFLTLTVISTSNVSATLTVFSALGQSLLTRQVPLFKGLNTVTIPIGTWVPATYFLVLRSGGNRLVKPFVKKSQ
jgi:hypothetical protein